ncbi:S-adenosyl-L-methionine-dependent methyltransferases superfamily protein isoform 1 [Gossypium australe]|uniref:S-adenosyl-L-methionine-dependent methyltransferases superfamily protein isoform 1 n=1 Tax=Gossypium australe TaxID=47621 RepID=A0A5B6U6Y7_9ROSI|nr:S-adenosyl-L-methionine-dependent methyltransferases superfamily protein isoform 1 [Gossypium australe]
MVEPETDSLTGVTTGLVLKNIDYLSAFGLSHVYQKRSSVFDCYLILREELETVEAFASELCVDGWICCKFQMLNRPLAPVLVFIFKR